MSEVNKAKTLYRPPKYLTYCLNYIACMVKNPESRMNIMPDIKNPSQSPYMNFLQNDVMYLLRITKKDLIQFNDDPVE